jgi:hypothetical protein
VCQEKLPGCHTTHRESRQLHETFTGVAFEPFVTALVGDYATTNRRKFPVCRKGRSLSGSNTKLLGIRRRIDRKQVLALLRSKFPEIVRPSWHESEVLRILKRRDIVLPSKGPGRYVRQIQVLGLNGRTRHDFILFRRRALRHAASRETIELIWPKKRTRREAGRPRLKDLALDVLIITEINCGGNCVIARGAAVVPAPTTANH